MTKPDLVDVASRRDERNIPIDKVGVKDLRYPIRLLDRAKGEQHTVGTFNMYVNLPQEFKGTHMSRFVEALNECGGEISVDGLRDILQGIRQRLHAESAHLEVEFPYFVEKEAPVSRARGLMEYGCRFVGSITNGDYDVQIFVRVPVSTLCPCSKEISDSGAHNQRGIITIGFRFERMVWIEEIIALAEESSSSAVYSMLKREDEKYVTELAYANPVFVEDVVRNVAQRLDAHRNITWYSVEVENFESIHNHNAYASLIKKK
ncbi:MAG: GTP cyclohydrolase I FolE2 [Myxococcales bacterium]|nr:GTP cyclohydrolase I FolE2 [Myxococcales bacterium]